jgi:ring-1,2-phenylacetyl-CoA epoxidase subunit PaaC
MSFDNAYEALADATDDPRWAFGTGPSEEPLLGADLDIPSDMDGADLAAYCLMLGDDALILSHRLQEWCTHAPELEDELAIANIGLDLLGQARVLLARAGRADGTGRSEDHYAFFRDAHEFRNVMLAEAPRGDFAELVVRLLVFATWRLALLRRLVDSRDPVLAALAAKGAKEVTYHRDYAAGWVVRLGDGTDFSRRRMQAGLDTVWRYVDELFVPHEIESRLAAAGVAVDPAGLRGEFDAVLAEVLHTATLPVPGAAGPSVLKGRSGNHSAALAEVLTELQRLPRALPEATW